MTTPKIEYNSTPDDHNFTLRSKEMDLHAGWLGRVFGSKDNAQLNIAGLIVVLLLVPGVVMLFFGGAVPAAEYWKIIGPLLSLVIGYVFGKSS